MHPPHDEHSDARAIWIGRAAFVWAGLIVLQLIYLQVVKHADYAKRADSQQLHEYVEQAQRGDIVDRNGHALAISVRTQTAVVNPQKIPSAEFFAGSVQEALGLTVAERRELTDQMVYLQRIKAKKELNEKLTSAEAHESLNQMVLKRHITDEQRDRLKRLPFKSLEFIDDSRRYYPNETVAAHVVGTLGIVGDDLEGVVGVEKKFDTELRGKPKLLKALTDSQQNRYVTWIKQKGEPGVNLHLTIHQVIQEEAETQLELAVKKNGGKRGFLVAMDPQTGEILALANYPSFDPSIEKPTKEEAETRVNQAVNLALEPGSVMKMITITTGLDTGKVTPETPVFCENGSWPRPNRKPIRDLHPYGGLDVAHVLIKSSNIGAAKVAVIIGRETLYNYLQRFGMGQRTDLGLPGESRGIFWPIDKWNQSTHEYIAFGHNISATPVQLARAVCVIANGGKLVSPTILLSKEYVDPESGRKTVLHVDRPAPRQVIKPETAHTVRLLMQQVVEEGTGTLAKIPGYTAGGKTGTAELIDPVTHQYLKNRNAASFMGFAPVVNPRIVIIATVYDTPQKGGPAAGPMFSAVARAALRVLNVPQDKFDAIAQKAADEAVVEEKKLPPLKAPPPQKAEPGPEPPPSRFLVGPKVPDFRGKSVPVVLKESAGAGVPVEIMGRGFARLQKPPAGAVLPPGERVLVEFARN